MNALRIALLACLLLVSPSVDAGKLSRARKQVREPAPASQPSSDAGKLDRASHSTRSEERRHGGSRHRRRRGCDNVCWGGSIGWTLPSARPVHVAPPVCVEQPVVVYTTPEPITYQVAPAVEQSFGEQFAAHPFANNADGFFTAAGDGKPWLGKLQIEIGDDSDEVSRTGFAFLIESEMGLGLDFDWDSYAEQLPGGGHDELHLGQVNLTYRILESDRALVRAGVGVGWLGDSIGTESGVNLTLQADLLPSEDWIASFDLDFGVLGDAETQHVSGTIGRRFGPCELYGGYDYRRLGDVNLHGPMVGLRLWW